MWENTGFSKNYCRCFLKQTGGFTFCADDKRGRCSPVQSKVLVRVESEPIDQQDQKKYKPIRKAGHLRMVVIPDLEGGTPEMNADTCIDKEAEVATDALPAYSLLGQTFAKHTAFNFSKLLINAHKLMPWVHIMISNAKRGVLAIHHHISGVIFPFDNKNCQGIHTDVHPTMHVPRITSHTIAILFDTRLPIPD